MPFKVCSCPKRDMQREDITTQRPLKREMKVFPYGKRPSKMLCLPEVKVEQPTPPPEINLEQPFPDTSHTVTLTMPNAESMKHVLRCAFNEVAGLSQRDKTAPPNRNKAYADKIKGLLDSL